MEQIEQTLRQHMVTDMALLQAEFLELNDPLELDSLAQTEMRIFIEETYKVPVGLDEMKPEATETLSRLVSYIEKQLKQQESHQAA